MIDQIQSIRNRRQKKPDLEDPQQERRPKRMGLTIGRKLGVSFASLVLLLVAMSLVFLLMIGRISNNVTSLVEVAEPLEKATLEMEINAGELVLDTFSYVQDFETEHLEGLHSVEY